MNFKEPYLLNPYLSATENSQDVMDAVAASLGVLARATLPDTLEEQDQYGSYLILTSMEQALRYQSDFDGRKKKR